MLNFTVHSQSNKMSENIDANIDADIDAHRQSCASGSDLIETPEKKGSCKCCCFSLLLFVVVIVLIIVFTLPCGTGQY